MDLSNQIINSFSNQIAEGGVSLKFDVFESNLINLSILWFGLVYQLGGALSENLLKRQ